jgi:hypothetical protein
MASKAPPIPPAQRSSPGDKAHIQGSAGDRGHRAASPKDQGRSATHHSHQQDR